MRPELDPDESVFQAFAFALEQFRPERGTMTTYVILEPDEWKMRWARPPVTERLADPETYIHHRAGNPHHTRDAAQVFYDMNEGAIANKGYSATDYDILVHENTVTDTVTIGIARGGWRSAATRDRNEEGEAICALGYFHPGHSLSERPSPAMIEGLARAVVISIERGWSAPDTTILGHRDNPAHPDATGCPGDYLYAELPTIRARVAELLAPPPPPPGDDDVLKFVQIEGFADQFALIAMSHETKRRNGAIGSTPLRVQSTLTRKQLEEFFGYELTPE